jgi:hypothetical protein
MTDISDNGDLTSAKDNDQSCLQPEFLQLALALQNIGRDGVEEMVRLLSEVLQEGRP